MTDQNNTEDLEVAEEFAKEIVRLEEGLKEVRLRHIYNAKDAGEALSVWILNGGKVKDFNPIGFGSKSEKDYRERRKLNNQLKGISNG